MANRVYFDGSGSYGTLDSTISLLDGETFSCDFRANLASGAGASSYDLVTNTAEDDKITILGVSSTQMRYTIEIAGSTYVSSDVTPNIFDGEDYALDFTRSGANFLVSVNGTLVATIAATTGVFEIDTVVADGFPCEISNIVIGDSTYPINTVTDPDTIEDTSVAGNDITLTGASRVCVGLWEWVGDFVHIDRSYKTQNGTVIEERKEGTRKRLVAGYPMETAINKQNGTESTVGIEAYNGGVISTLGLVTSTIDCDIENFTPTPGTAMFIQTQTWVSYDIQYPS